MTRTRRHKAPATRATADGTRKARRGEDGSSQEQGDRALVLHPHIKSRRGRGPGGPVPGSRREPETRLAEATGLAAAIGLMVVHAEVVPVSSIHPGQYLGRGRIADFAALIRGLAVDVVVFDGVLSPVQQRNLEKTWAAKVIDRTGLILEIFGARARTREGRLQVELAHLDYQKSRLVRSWTHLERQRGGFGFLGGPGETQIEADRRMIDVRIGKIRRDLETVVRTRDLHRRSRRKVPYSVVALVGYTNAGKSTLFNRITGSGVEAADRLFATLDPTMREAVTPSGTRIILSDTVGFISDLPTSLVAAFRATLEEVIEADLIVHVRDIANPDTDAQKADVLEILYRLGVDGAETPILEALNKVDLLDPDSRQMLANQALRDDTLVPVSAVTGDGVGDLLERIDRRLAAGRQVIELTLGHGDGAALAWLHRHGDVRRQHEDADAIYVTVSLDPDDVARFSSRTERAGRQAE